MTAERRATRRADGRWVATVQIGRGSRTGRLRRYVYGSTEAEALAKRAMVLETLADSTSWEMGGRGVAVRFGADGLGEIYDTKTRAVLVDRVTPFDWPAADVVDGRVTLHAQGTVTLSASLKGVTDVVERARKGPEPLVSAELVVATRRELEEQGVSAGYAAIARRLGVDASTVRRRLGRL